MGKDKRDEKWWKEEWREIWEENELAMGWKRKWMRILRKNFMYYIYSIGFNI